MQIVGRIPHATRPNEALEQQIDKTVPGMYHFAVPGAEVCGMCLHYGPMAGIRKGKRHRCRKAVRAGIKVSLGLYHDNCGCKYHEPRPPKPEKARRARKVKGAV